MSCNVYVNFLRRTLISARFVMTKWDIRIRWKSSDSIWTTDRPAICNRPIRRRHASNPFSGASNLWSMPVNVAMQIVGYLLARR